MTRFLMRILKFREPHSILLEQWSIGMYRLMLENNRLVITEPPGMRNPILTAKSIRNERSGFVADPFIVRSKEKLYMFLEVFKDDKAAIGYAISREGREWKYKGLVLEETFHLSYPFVLHWKGKYFMIPESYQTNSVRVYEAIRFPDTWRYAKTILVGREFVDPTFIHLQQKLWLFVSDTTNANLYLYSADSLDDEWQEHPRSPIIRNDDSTARPAGGIIQFNNRLIRVAQDCHETYGKSVRVFEITTMSTTEYSERELPESPLMTASGRGWSKDGMHHLSLCPIGTNEWLAAVDGKVINTFTAPASN